MEQGKRANRIVGFVIAAVFVAACVAFAWTQFGSPHKGELVALVHDGEGNTYELPLDKDAELVVETSFGINIVEVCGGEVLVREADCDNQDCVHQGSISTPGRQIICLPHKLWIEVVASGDEGSSMDVNAVAGGEYDLDVVAR